MGTFQLTNENYFSIEANKYYWSKSQFASFQRCEAAAMAEVQGRYQREETTSLLVGSYVDAYYSDELDLFFEEHPDVFNKRTGELKADYRHADEIIATINQQPVMTDFMAGKKQEIRTAELFGVPWKIKMDFYLPDERIVDLKIMKDFDSVYNERIGTRQDWIAAWGYDIQGAVYQRIEQLSAGRSEPLPFYILAATKEKVPDIALIHIPQHYLDAALKIVESKIDRFDLIKAGVIAPDRCGSCEFCRRTKVITSPEEYEMLGE